MRAQTEEFSRDSRLTLFGETKTVREWFCDRRCPVDEDTVLRRLQEGEEPFAAVTRPYGVVAAFDRAAACGGHFARNEGHKARAVRYLTAWGETKTVQEWADDPRSRVEPNLIWSRVGRGWSPEDAISKLHKFRPSPFLSRRLQAFGHDLTVREWLESDLCQADYKSLYQRVRKQWPTEQALSTPVGERHAPRWVLAFGERKRVCEWASDPRCVVAEHLILQRLKAGWDTEGALTTPPLEPGLRSNGNPMTYQDLTAFGATKRMRDWPADPRCKVGIDELKRRIESGWSPEEAVSTPIGDRSRMVAKSSKCLTAWGETKTMKQWAEDPRCKVSFGTLKNRVLKDYTVEEAMTAPVGVKRRVPKRPTDGKTVSAFGETKNVAAWSMDPRCVPTPHVLYSRLSKGWPLERALTAPLGARSDGGQGPADGQFRPMPVWDAFGEKKGTAEWARDPRCRVSESTLGARLKNGWSVEEALKTPTMGYGVQRGKTAVRNKNYIAFGEVKPLKKWAKDSRCAVDLDLLVKRVMSGWDMERAMTQAVRLTGPKRKSVPHRRAA